MQVLNASDEVQRPHALPSSTRESPAGEAAGSSREPKRRTPRGRVFTLLLHWGAVVQPLHWQVMLCTQRPPLLQYQTSIPADFSLEASPGRQQYRTYLIASTSHQQRRNLQMLYAADQAANCSHSAWTQDSTTCWLNTRSKSRRHENHTLHTASEMPKPQVPPVLADGHPADVGHSALQRWRICRGVTQCASPSMFSVQAHSPQGGSILVDVELCVSTATSQQTCCFSARGPLLSSVVMQTTACCHCCGSCCSYYAAAAAVATLPLLPMPALLLLRTLPAPTPTPHRGPPCSAPSSKPPALLS